MPIPKSYLATSAKAMESHITNSITGRLVYSIMAQPLEKTVPAFCTCLFTTDNKFTAENVLNRWNFIRKEFLKCGIEVLGFSADGDPRLLKAMRMHVCLGIQNDSKCDPKEVENIQCDRVDNCEKTSDKNDVHIKWPFFNRVLALNFHVIQDTTHIGTKLRNRLLKTTLLPLGKTVVTVNHLKLLMQLHSEDKHKLTESDLNPKDRMNFPSVEKICSSVVTYLMSSNIPESEGTCLFLKIIKCFICFS